MQQMLIGIIIVLGPTKTPSSSRIKFIPFITNSFLISILEIIRMNNIRYILICNYSNTCFKLSKDADLNTKEPFIYKG